MDVFKFNHTNIYVFSDPHYGHPNICRGVSNWGDNAKTRDFPTLEAMNDAIVNNIINTIPLDAEVFCLGDWSFGGFDNIVEFRERLPHQNLHLVLGNHDHHIKRNKHDVQKLFTSVNRMIDIHLSIPTPNNGKHLKYNFVACHFPIASWENVRDGVMHIHGHEHWGPEMKISKGRMMDCGLDGNENFQPYNIMEIVDLLKNRPKLSLLYEDHHI